MPFNMTSSEAASKLGVGVARINQLIKNGTLDAEKVGGIWLLDSASVDARLAANPKAGRPLKTTNELDSKTFMLMNGPYAVLEFSYNATNRSFYATRKILDASRTPLTLASPRGKAVSAAALSSWWKHRAIPGSRSGLPRKLKELEVQEASEIPFRSFGLSLSDQYWIKPSEAKIDWHDINFFENSFGHLGMDSDDWLGEVGLKTPDNTSEGELPKRWICEDGKRILLKGGGPLGQEPYNECVATALYARLLEPEEFVTYQLLHTGTVGASICEVFINAQEEYIPAHYVRQTMRQPNHRNGFQHYLECCANIGIAHAETAVSKMIVCDSILGNHDRHWRNFGIIRNIDTLQCRIAPLFDSGSSLWCNVPTSLLASGNYAFSTKPFFEDANKQLRLVSDYSWFKRDTLEGFADEAMSILGACPALGDRLDYLHRALCSRIDHVLRVSE